MGHYERTITEAHATVERIEQRQQADKPEKDGQADKLAAARDVLLDLIPWWIGRAEFYRGDNSKLPLIASACRREEDRLRKVFHIVPKPAGADEEGNRREIARQLPALPVEAAVHAHLRDGDSRIDLSGWRSELGNGLETAPDDLVPSLAGPRGTTRPASPASAKPHWLP